MENKLLIIQELSGLRKKGKFEEIVDLCTENLKSDPDNLFLLRANAHAAYEIGRIPAFSVVLTCIEKILEQSPNDIESLILQVRTLRRLNWIDEAKISLELAERIESDNPDEIKWLMSQEEILMEALGIQDTYDERVETRKELRKVREDLKSKISTPINT